MRLPLVASLAPLSPAPAVRSPVVPSPLFVHSIPLSGKMVESVYGALVPRLVTNTVE